MQGLKGLATGAGSMPQKEASAAVDLIFKYCPAIPFWPQLPKINPNEGMIAQFSGNIPIEKPTDQDLEKFYEELIKGDVEYFRINEDVASGLYAFKKRLKEQPKLLDAVKFIKGQITGPFTFAASAKDISGSALLHDPISMQVIIKGLMMKALWQVQFFKEFGKRMVIFIDEPYLGCFGSAYTPLNREDVVKGLTELAEGIKSKDVLIGVHCCGNTDWSIFTEVKAIDIINFDAFSFLDKFVLYADSLKGFLERDGVICWGVVPTQEFQGTENARELVKKVEEGMDVLEKKGVARSVLQENMLLSPSCGLGTLDEAKATAILTLLQQTSQEIQQK